MNTEKNIDVLNTLIQINNDRIEGYETASGETEETELKTLFSQYIQTSRNNKTELLTEVDKMGGTPIEGTKATGKIYRIWMDFKAILTGHDRRSILSSCEFGEDAALDTYDKVIRNDYDDISFEYQTLINTQYARIKGEHDKIKEMRDMVVEHK